MASYYGFEEHVEELLKLGADPNIQNEDGLNAISDCCRWQRHISTLWGPFSFVLILIASSIFDIKILPSPIDPSPDLAPLINISTTLLLISSETTVVIKVLGIAALVIVEVPLPVRTSTPF